MYLSCETPYSQVFTCIVLFGAVGARALQVVHPAILNGKTWSKLGEHGEQGEHGDDLKHSTYDSKHSICHSSTRFINQISELSSFCMIRITLRIPGALLNKF